MLIRTESGDLRYLNLSYFNDTQTLAILANDRKTAKFDMHYCRAPLLRVTNFANVLKRKIEETTLTNLHWLCSRTQTAIFTQGHYLHMYA